MSTQREEKYGQLVVRIERTTELPLLIFAFFYLLVFLTSYLPQIPENVTYITEMGENMISAIFAAELLVRLAVAERRLSYLRANWLDVIIVLVPFLRPIRFLRVLRLLPFLARGVLALRRIMGPYRGSYVLVVGLLSVMGSATLIAIFESDSGGTIKNFGDALWWSVTTITTVGYGDMVPVTPEGRAVAVFLMIVGISLFGILTASVAAYFVESTEENRTGAEIHHLADRIASVETQLDEHKQLLLTLVQRTQQEEHDTDERS